MVHRFKKETTNYELSTTNRNSTGFTLIELLVVIAIVGVLATLGTFTYTDSQKKSRDSRRKSDLVSIQKALELMKQDTAGNYSYPYCNSGSTCVLSTSITTPAITSSYIKVMPTDPKTNTGYTYNPLTSVPAACSSPGPCTSYQLVACLENIKDQQKEFADGNPSDKCGGGTANGLVGYVITNL